MIRRFIAMAVVATGVGILLIAAANAWVIHQAGKLAHQPEELSPASVALILGTSPYAAGGGQNRHFAGRMKAAALLYHSGTVQHILASGANPTIYYNEPQRMLDALIELGVPETAITLDYAGRRTLDSVARARRIFDLERVIIVSQAFHLYRALYLAKNEGLEAQGFVAEGPKFSQRWRVELREYLARVLAVADSALLGTEPEVLGELEPLEP